MGEDEKACPQCAETIKAAAKVCKHCGYNLETMTQAAAVVRQLPPAKKGGKAKGCLIVVGVVVVLLVVSAIFAPSNPGNTPNATSSSEPEVPPVAVTAKELAGAYDANEAAAQQKYGDRRLEVSGTITGVNLDIMDNPVVLLAGTNQFMPVQASLSDASKPKASGLAKGQKITMQCEKVSEVIGAPMLDNCWIP